MLNFKKYMHEDKGFEIEAIWFDGELWLYERSKAYPILTCKDFPNGNGIFGFNYGPTLIGKSFLIEHGDYIVKINGEYSVMKPNYFLAFYKEKIITQG